MTPLFSIGASLGVILAGFMGLPVMLAAALGYAAVFGSATNTLLAPIFIGAEVFGYEYLPLFAVACLASHISVSYTHLRKGAYLPEQNDCVFLNRLVAWCKLDFCALGLMAWGIPAL